jgi:acetolactate synthase-1/2/3 large subunit
VTDVIDYLKSQHRSDDRQMQRLKQIDEIRGKTGYNSPPILPAAAGTLHHTEVVAAMQKFLQPNDMLSLDAGSNRIWATNSLRMRTPNHLLVPGGIGGMGWGGPAAAAAKLAMPEKRVTCLAGDGGFMMTMDVVATCAQYDIPVVFAVSNNSGLGMVRDNMGEKKIAVDFGEIDFAKAAEGFGAIGMRVDNRSGLEDALAQAHEQQGPVVIDIKVDPAASFKPAADTDPLE